MTQDKPLSEVEIKKKLCKLKKNFEEAYGFPCSMHISIQASYGQVGGEW